MSAYGAIDAGITTLLDWSHIQNTPEHTDASIATLRESGLRAVFAYGTPNLDLAAWWYDSTLTHPTDVRRVATQYFSSNDQRTTGTWPASSACGSACTSASAKPA